MSSDPDIAAALLRQAADLVAGDRAMQYGDPQDDFQCTAAAWTAYLLRRRDTAATYELTPADVAVMMILVKVSRLAKTPGHADSWRDIAGYAACGARVAGAAVVVDHAAPAPSPGHPAVPGTLQTGYSVPNAVRAAQPEPPPWNRDRVSMREWENLTDWVCRILAALSSPTPEQLDARAVQYILRSEYRLHVNDVEAAALYGSFMARHKAGQWGTR